MKNTESLKDVIEKYKNFYNRLTPIYSDAIKEQVYFNMAGFKHLIFKNKHRRKNSEIYNRMVLIPLIRPVIRKCKNEIETRIREEIIDGKEVVVEYKALEAKVGKSSTRVRVVIKKIGKKGRYYFQSIMKYN
ncbi:hypothetical protein IKF03_02005 [Candidatus Saccharibacteria bacterium]|nr:hypothetical protein [Candidatus Saccharibacteria bacterium]